MNNQFLNLKAFNVLIILEAKFTITLCEKLK